MTERGMLTEMTQLALPIAWNVRRPSEWICAPEERGKYEITDRPTNRPPGHTSQACVRVGWMEKWTEVQSRWRVILTNFIISG